MSDPHRPDAPSRDPVLDAAWDAHSTELPPARIDAAILAAAHRETRTRPRAVSDDDASAHSRRPARAWWGLAAAAAIGAIAFGVVQLAPPPIDKHDSMVASDVPATPPAPAPSAPSESGTQLAQAPATAPASTPSERIAMSRSEGSNAAAPPEARARADAPPRKAPKAAKAGDAGAPRPAESNATVADRERQRSTDESARADAAKSERGEVATTPRTAQIAREPRVAAVAPPASPEPPPPVAAARPFPVPSSQRADAPAQPLAKLRTQTPEAWIERIRMLHAQQRFDEAARELNAFRGAYPDADRQLPAALAAWAAGVKPDR